MLPRRICGNPPDKPQRSGMCLVYGFVKNEHFMMTSSSGNNFRVTGPLWGESIGHWLIPRIKPSDAELSCLLWSVPEQTVEQIIETPMIWDAIGLIIFAVWYKADICKTNTPPSSARELPDVPWTSTGTRSGVYTERLSEHLHGERHPRGNTVRYRYNAVHFFQTSHNRHPIARPWGRCIWCLCSSVCNMMLYCTAL